MIELYGNSKGIALFLVLWVLTLLSVIVGEFCHAMRTEVNITRNYKEKIQAYYIAHAGLQSAIEGLTEVRNRPASISTTEVDNGWRWRINTDLPEVSFGVGSYQVRIDNEAGRIDLNGADAALLYMMLQPFDMEEEKKRIIVDSILDWRDPDSFHRLNGAEDEYYRGLPDPYEATDGPFSSVEELLLVREVTPALFHGGLREMVTVTPVMPSPRGDRNAETGKQGAENRININAAPPRVLLALPKIDPTVLEQILEFRAEKDFRSASEIVTVVGGEVYAAIRSHITLEESPFYFIRSSGHLAGSRVESRLGAMIFMDENLEEKYRIVRWMDRI